MKSEFAYWLWLGLVHTHWTFSDWHRDALVLWSYDWCSARSLSIAVSLVSNVISDAESNDFSFTFGVSAQCCLSVALLELLAVLTLACSVCRALSHISHLITAITALSQSLIAFSMRSLDWSFTRTSLASSRRPIETQWSNDRHYCRSRLVSSVRVTLCRCSSG